MPEPWKISLHGGHSGEFCEHGYQTLRQFLDAAVEYGYSTFGLSAHAPASSHSTDQRFLYEDEISAGLTTDELSDRFSKYATTSEELTHQYIDRIEVLRGAEVEVVPEDRFAAQAKNLVNRYNLDYIVGSVHWVDDTPFDFNNNYFKIAVNGRGNLQQFLIRYYELVATMIEQLNPEVIGHLDLPRLFSEGSPEHESQKTKQAIDSLLQLAAENGTILDLNVSALRKGLLTPYCSPWIVKRANELGVPFCFGDDSHSIEEVGAFLDQGRDYLLANGVETITTLTRRNKTISKKIIPLV
ncbi:MAG: hypothetical protein CL791_05090 [Chloroflexi bacterium]|nr:hypothetical protein [Chloroflexota bacterium]|tara:strand:+ start:65 stop:958 length:894 start_codon:yes stop_codon:yes gene_type:complete